MVHANRVDSCSGLGEEACPKARPRSHSQCLYSSVGTDTGADPNACESAEEYGGRRRKKNVVNLWVEMGINGDWRF